MVMLALKLHNENVNLKQFICFYPLVKMTSFNFWLAVLNVFYLFKKYRDHQPQISHPSSTASALIEFPVVPVLKIKEPSYSCLLTTLVLKSALTLPLIWGYLNVPMQIA